MQPTMFLPFRSRVCLFVSVLLTWSNSAFRINRKGRASQRASRRGPLQSLLDNIKYYGGNSKDSSPRDLAVARLEPPTDAEGLYLPWPCDGPVIGRCTGTSSRNAEYVPRTCQCADESEPSGAMVHDFFCQSTLPPVATGWANCAFARTFDYADADSQIASPFFIVPSGEAKLAEAQKGAFESRRARKRPMTYPKYARSFVSSVSKGGVKVLHDLDDTVVCSGGAGVSYPGYDPKARRPIWVKFIEKGIDTRIATHEKYPAVGTFFYALTLGKRTLAEQGGVWPPIDVSMRPVPMTARPDAMGIGPIFLGVQACDDTHGKDFDLKLRQEVCGAACTKKACDDKAPACDCFGEDVKQAKYGNVTAPMSGDFQYEDGVTTRQYPVLAYNKYLSWRDSVLPETSVPCIFVGDNGQGDLQAAQMMLIESKTMLIESKTMQRDRPAKDPVGAGGRVIAAFIHDVRGQCPAGSDCRRAWSYQDIFFFTDYAEAADIAYDQQLIEVEARDRVKAKFEEERHLYDHKPEPPGEGRFGQMLNRLSEWRAGRASEPTLVGEPVSISSAQDRGKEKSEVVGDGEAKAKPKRKKAKS